MQPDLGFQFDHARRDLDQSKAQRVELRNPPAERFGMAARKAQSSQ